MSLLNVQTLEAYEATSDGVIDVSYAALNASTTKVVIGVAGVVLDAASPNDCSFSSALWDQGGNDDTVQHASGCEISFIFTSDRYIYSTMLAVDSPTTSAGNLQITFAFTSATAVDLCIIIWEFDNEADTGVTGSTGTYSSNSDSGCATTQTTGANDHIVVSVWSHQLNDANPYAVSNILTTEDYDADSAAGSAGFGAGHGTASGGSDTATVTGSGSARRVCMSSYEVMQTISSGAVSNPPPRRPLRFWKGK